MGRPKKIKKPKPEPPVAKCPLCLEDKKLVQSHIYPKFIFKWMKETGDNSFRRIEDPNQIVYDGEKPHLLCATCDNELLGGPEGRFSREIFFPLVNKTTLPKAYNKTLHFVFTSMAWRFLELTGDWRAPQGYDAHLSLLEAARKEWRDYLFGQTPSPPTFSEMHLIVAPPKGINRMPLPNHEVYMARFTDGAVVSCGDRCAVYVKIPRLLAFFPLTATKPEVLQNTRISPAGGQIDYPQAMHDDWLGSIIFDSAQRVLLAFNRRSSTQLKRDALGLLRRVGSDWEESVQADRGAWFESFLRGGF
jgi:hypothetical protein